MKKNPKVIKEEEAIKRTKKANENWLKRPPRKTPERRFSNVRYAEFVDWTVMDLEGEDFRDFFK